MFKSNKFVQTTPRYRLFTWQKESRQPVPVLPRTICRTIPTGSLALLFNSLTHALDFETFLLGTCICQHLLFFTRHQRTILEQHRCVGQQRSQGGSIQADSPERYFQANIVTRQIGCNAIHIAPGNHPVNQPGNGRRQRTDEAEYTGDDACQYHNGKGRTPVGSPLAESVQKSIPQRLTFQHIIIRKELEDDTAIQQYRDEQQESDLSPPRRTLPNIRRKRRYRRQIQRT